MARATVDGLSIGYEVIGDGGQPWVLTPGARDGKDTPGLRELATELADRGNQVLIWDRPNCGESDVCFDGPSESVMQADVLAGLLSTLGMTPAVIAGGSGGSRVSLLTAARHRELAAGVAVWWITGGVMGLLSLGTYYCSPSIRAAWNGGMDAVIALPEWSEVLTRNPSNEARFLAQHPTQFIATLEQWMLAYCPCGDEAVPGLTTEDAQKLDRPALVFRSGTSDMHHRRETSEQLAHALPNARLVEPPWGDTEWPERSAAYAAGEAPGRFMGWPQLAPILHDWATDVLP